jgi:hypothetical protein
MNETPCPYGLADADHVISADEAVALLTAASWRDQKGCEYCDHVCDPGDAMVHTFAGPFGADWTLAAAIEHVRAASKVGWGHGLFRHDLGAFTPDDPTAPEGPGRVVWFSVPHPGRPA